MFGKKEDVKEETPKVEEKQEESSTTVKEQPPVQKSETDSAAEKVVTEEKQEKEEVKEVKEEVKVEKDMDMSENVRQRINALNDKHAKEIEDLKRSQGQPHQWTPEEIQQKKEDVYTKTGITPEGQDFLLRAQWNAQQGIMNNINRIEAYRQLDSLKSNQYYKTYGKQLEQELSQIQNFSQFADQRTGAFQSNLVETMFKQILANNLDEIVNAKKPAPERKIVSAGQTGSVRDGGDKNVDIKLTESEQKYFNKLIDPNSSTTMTDKDAYDVIKYSRKPNKGGQ